jgi:hypothetical protein
VNVEQRPFGAASACENQHDAERSAERDEEPAGFCRRSRSDENLIQCKNEQNDQRHSSQRVNYDSRKIRDARRWPRKNVRGREEQDRKQNSYGALHRSIGRVRERSRKDTVMSIGKEACILIRMSWTGNNTFILGGAKR